MQVVPLVVVVLIAASVMEQQQQLATELIASMFERCWRLLSGSVMVTSSAEWLGGSHPSHHPSENKVEVTSKSRVHTQCHW